MKVTVTTTVYAVLLVIVGVQQVVARPSSRIKRISDSHLSDLETKIALNNKIRGFAITMPVGAGKIDPFKIFVNPNNTLFHHKMSLSPSIHSGRRRRSDSGFLDRILNQSEEDNGDPVPVQLDYEDFLYNYLH